MAGKAGAGLVGSGATGAGTSGGGVLVSVMDSIGTTGGGGVSGVGWVRDADCGPVPQPDQEQMSAVTIGSRNRGPVQTSNFATLAFDDTQEFSRRRKGLTT